MGRDDGEVGLGKGGEEGQIDVYEQPFCWNSWVYEGRRRMGRE